MLYDNVVPESGVGISIPSVQPRLKPLLLSVVLCLPLLGAPARSQDEDSKKILAFALAWRGPQDYIWTRESLSKTDPEDQVGVRIKDSGRIRVETLYYENESAVMDPRILRYRYETELPGEPIEKRTSPLEGIDLPLVWLHSVMGFSVGLEPGTGEGVQDMRQAGEALDILDFRGFVPDTTPVPGKKWTSHTAREADSTYAFSESVEREFECLQVTEEEGNSICRVRFEELVKTTPTSKSRSSEIRERAGTFQVRMPQGLIQEVVWESTSREYLRTDGSRRTIETKTSAHIQRRDPPLPRSKAERKKAAEEEEPLPKPPR